MIKTTKELDTNVFECIIADVINYYVKCKSWKVIRLILGYINAIKQQQVIFLKYKKEKVEKR